jgi:hypothetical protein
MELGLRFYRRHWRFALHWVSSIFPVPFEFHIVTENHSTAILQTNWIRPRQEFVVYRRPKNLHEVGMLLLDPPRTLTWLKNPIRIIPNYCVTELHWISFRVAIQFHDLFDVGNAGRKIIFSLWQIRPVRAHGSISRLNNVAKSASK